MSFVILFRGYNFYILPSLEIGDSWATSLEEPTLLETCKQLHRKMQFHWKWYSSLHFNSQETATSFEMA